jgi:hypothetical protein
MVEGRSIDADLLRDISPSQSFEALFGDGLERSLDNEFAPKFGFQSRPCLLGSFCGHLPHWSSLRPDLPHQLYLRASGT